MRGRYALLRLDGDPAMRQGFIRDIDPAGPAEQARRDCEEALRLRPQWIEPWHLAGLASMRRAEEHLAAGRFEEAGSCFRREIETLRHTIESWRADGSPSLAESIDVTTETVQVAETLAAICAMAPAERSAAYDDLRRRAPDAGLPALPRR